jgi:hypothetical protein
MPAMPDSVDSLVRAFVLDLSNLMRRQLDAEVALQVRAVLDGVLRAAQGSHASGARQRSAATRARDTARVLAAIKKQPGSRSEQLAKMTSLTTAELVAPLRALLADKTIKRTGAARGTSYTARR